MQACATTPHSHGASRCRTEPLCHPQNPPAGRSQCDVPSQGIETPEQPLQEPVTLARRQTVLTRWPWVQVTHPGQIATSVVKVPALFCLAPLGNACQEWCFFYIMVKFLAELFSALLGSPQNILLMWQVTREGLGLSNLLNTGFCARACIMTLGPWGIPEEPHQPL